MMKVWKYLHIYTTKTIKFLDMIVNKTYYMNQNITDTIRNEVIECEMYAWA